MAYDETTAARVRSALSARSVVERKMMGGICFMVDGHMCCGVSREALMVRVGRDGYREALAQPHVRPMEFGGRSPTGFVLVDPVGYRTDAALKKWITRSLGVVAALPPREPGSKRR
ncbi:hypothetical protein WPS_11000 [Vulcanimicrobium alpinum]|uniref:TfoX N-terminal domain-containing protein n=1 Tax=Vulcanimicrobium alpinum TaxID=3016050 RepID=A0AAN1XUU1_UNVUL|nr:TfoX/Sxy family protein [Vulcanimicrobium alpinum]BDE05824.1 hypothetical protein WPS_11000 [Vulcanimicrobium alpinum]